MYKQKYIGLGLGICLALASCKVPAITQLTANTAVPNAYGTAGTDSTNMAKLPWRSFFTDKNLVNLIDTALKNNQELMITLQEIQMAQNDIQAKHGKLLPTVGVRAGVGVEKVGRYTSQGAGDATTEITPGQEFPDPLMDYSAAIYANWEIDVWKKLRNAKKAAIIRYLSSVEGKILC
jgi:multidrug efflux system outer membrane protein